MAGRSILLLVAAAAIVGVLAWSLRPGVTSGPSLPEFAGGPSSGVGGDVRSTPRAGGDRIAIEVPAGPDLEEPATVDPDRARESARLVVVGVARSRLPNASRFVGARVELSSAAAKRPRVGRLDTDLRATFERLDPVEVFQVVVSPADGLRTVVSDVRLAPGEERTLEVELAVGGTIFGRVLDAAGEPLASATLMVRVDSAPDSEEPTWRRRAILDEDATFEMRGVRPGVVWAELHAGAVNMAEELGAIEEAQTLGPLVLQLPEGNVLEGVVTWPDGAPAVDARVAANLRFRSESSGSSFARADEEGRYRLVALAPGYYEVTATPGATRADVDGAAGHLAWGEANAPGTLDLTLEPGLSISGTVVDDLGTPVTSFRVSAEMRRPGSHGPSWRVPAETLGQEPGEFVIRGLRPGTWILTAADRGGVSAVEEEVLLAGDRHGLRLVLPRPARISGVVRDAAGAGRAGVWVYAVRPPRDDGRADPRAPRRAQSRTDGVFTIDRVAPGRVLVGKSSDDPRALVLELAPGEEREDVVLRFED